MIKKFCLWFLLLYKRLLSPFIGKNCKYTPTCSMYAYDSVKNFGAFRGVLLALWRVLRCNPFSKGGFDPAPENYKGNIKWLL